MDLIDILKQILNTKNELRDILLSFLADKQDNFSKYPNDFSQIPTAIHNAVATLYNQGYVDGYSETYTQEFGFPRYTAEPLQMLDYNISSIYYESYSTDILTDIMRDVLNYREQMKSSDKLDTESDYFPSYPDYLNYLLNSIYDRGYDDGVVKAHNDILPDEEVHAPTFSFSNNQFTLSTDQSSARLYFSIGLNGVPINYTGPVTITETCTVYYWAVIGKAKNPGESDDPYIPLNYRCEYSSSGYRPERELVPPRYNNIDNIVYLSVDDDSNIEYSIDDEDFQVYNGPIQLGEEFSTGDHTISMRSFVNEQVSPTATQEIIYQTSTIIERPAKPELSLNGTTNVLTMTCSTAGASMYYYIATDNAQPESETEYTLYTEPITLENSCIFWYYSEKDSLINEGGIQYAPIYIYVAPVVYPQNVQFTPIYDPSTGGYYLQLWSPSAGSHIFYSYNNTEDWVEVESNRVNIYPSPSEVFTVYAYSKKDNTESKDITSFDWSQYQQERYIEAPTFNRVGNRVLISSPYQVYYSTDGNNPYIVWGNQESQRGLVIPTDSYLVVKAKAVLYDPSLDTTLTSEIVTETYYYDSTLEEPSQPYESEYFTLEGCSGFTLTVSDTSNYNLYYSYDKANWTGIVSSVSGLDSGRKVYVKGYCGSRGKYWTTMTFNSDENITISGNIVSLWYGDTFTQNTNIPNVGGQCKRMFYNNTCSLSCQNLVMPFTSTYSEMFSEMFCGCTGLTSAPQRLNFSSVSHRACERMFYGCSSLITGPEFNFTNIDGIGCSEMFSGCSSLSSCGEFNLSSCGSLSLNSTFSGCSSLNSIYFVLTSSCNLSDSCCKNAFFGCTSLAESGIQLLATSLSDSCYQSMFSGCSSLTHFSFLPATALTRNCYRNMFSNCTSLTSFGSISALSLADNCCDSMFSGCSNLTKAPTLLAPELNGNYCYQSMFSGCSSLNYIKALFLTDPSQGNWTRNWVYGVADEGTFVQDEDAEWLVIGTNGIPVGWVHNNTSTDIGSIRSISNIYDKITITASNSDTIYYQINGTDDDRWIQYTGPFTIDYPCIVYAKCVDSRGNSGDISYKEITFATPAVVINTNNNSFSISNPSGYTYKNFYYKLTSYGGETVIQDWTLYTQDVILDDDTRIYAQGLTNGNTYGGLTYVDYRYQVYPSNVVISDATSDNKVTLSCSTVGASIYYRILPSSEWIQYGVNPITINSDCTIEACSWLNGIYSTSNTTKTVIYTPVTSQVDTPSISCNNNTVTITCSTDGATIYYRIGSSGDYSIYSSSFSIQSTVTVYSYATKSGMYDSETTSQECQYIGDYTNEYLTFEILEDGVVSWKAYSNTNTKTIQYKKNNGKWTDITSSTNGSTISVNNGDILKFKGNNYTYCDNSYNYNYFNTTCYFNISGNIMSLIDSSGFRTRTTFYAWQKGQRNFMNFFMDCTKLISAENLILPVTTLLERCYQNMFGNCINLISAPKSLPATKLDIACYKSMFYGCTQLENIPTILPATSGYEESYAWMFYGCSNLETVPEIKLTSTGSAINYGGCCESMFEGCVSITAAPELIATSLGPGCYKNMFKDCINLISSPTTLPATNIMNYPYCYESMFEGCTNLINAPRNLPATVPAPVCYRFMFKDCISLTTAPEIYAEELTTGCFIRMFYGCSSLNSIICHAKNNITEDDLRNWVYGVSSTGTFTKARTSTWPSGASGIPEGWTIHNTTWLQ